jgi:N-acetylglucosaminyl-diphospho-decaprenol L-rhamnosyltransferase
MAAPALEVVVVHHRVPTLLVRTLEALAAHRPDAPVLVVDTALDASLPRQLEGVHPSLRWRAVANHSYASAVNAGLKDTTAPLVAVMNADVEIHGATFDDLIATMDDPTVAMAGPLARTPAGHLQDQGLAYRWHVARLRWATRRARSGGATTPAPSVAVPWLSGCLLLVRRDAIARVGGMDAGLRFFNEDLEWAQRFRGAGARCVLVATEVLHVGGASTPADGRFLVEGLRGGYALTRRRGPRWLRAAHRWAVAGFATVAEATARDAAARATWRDVRRRFVHHDLDASPFGPTLDVHATSALQDAPAGR